MADVFTVECPECSKKLTLKGDASVGKEVPCPKCKTPFVIRKPGEASNAETPSPGRERKPAAPASRPRDEASAKPARRPEPQKRAKPTVIEDRKPGTGRPKNTPTQRTKPVPAPGRKPKPRPTRKPVQSADVEDYEDLDGPEDEIVDFDDAVADVEDYADDYDSEPYEDDYADEDFDSAPRGKSKGKRGKKRRGGGSGGWKKPVVVTVSVLLGLAALGGIGYAVMLFLPGFSIGGGVDYTYLPPNLDRVSVYHYGSMWNSSVVQKSLEYDPHIAADVAAMKAAFDLEPGDVKSVTHGYSDADKQSITVVRTSKPMNPEKIMSVAGNHETTEHQGQTYYKAGGVAAWFPDAKTMIQGSEEAVQAAVSRGATGSRPESFAFADTGYQHVSIRAPGEAKQLDNNPLVAMIDKKENQRDEFSGVFNAMSTGYSYTSGRKGVIQVNCTSKETATEVERRLDKAVYFLYEQSKIAYDQAVMAREQLEWRTQFAADQSEAKLNKMKRSQERLEEAADRAVDAAGGMSASQSGTSVRLKAWGPAPAWPTDDDKQLEDYVAPRSPLQVRTILSTIGGVFALAKMPERQSDVRTRDALSTGLPGGGSPFSRRRSITTPPGF